MAGKKISDLSTRTLSLSDFIVTANPVNGLAGKSTIQALMDLINPSGAPITEYTNYTTLLAQTDLLANYFAWVLDGTDEGYTGWVLYKYNGGDPTLLTNYSLIISQDIWNRFLPLLVNSDLQVVITESLGFQYDDAGQTAEIVLDPNNTGALGKGVYFLEDRTVKKGFGLRGFGETNEDATDGDYSELKPTSLMPVQMGRNEFLSKVITEDYTEVLSESATSNELYFESSESGSNNYSYIDLVSDASSASSDFGASVVGVGTGRVSASGLSASLEYAPTGSGGVNPSCKADASGVTTRGKKIVNSSGFATAGVATLIAGTKTVNTSQILTASKVRLTVQTLGTVAIPQAVCIANIVNATSFDIVSASVTDTSVVLWEIIEIV